MTLMKRLIAFVGIAALMMGTVAGLATSVNAQNSIDEDDAIGSVRIGCLGPATVQLQANFEFDEITDLMTDNDTKTDDGAIVVIVNTGCYFGPWQVSASATNFTSATSPSSFGADHLSLEAEDVDYFFENTALDFVTAGLLEPHAHDVTFDCPSLDPLGACGEVILHTSTNLLTFILNIFIPGTWTANPAPFETVASYTGFLDDLPFLVNVDPNGDLYTSTLTVELTTD